jgi:hypothetical protein
MASTHNRILLSNEGNEVLLPATTRMNLENLLNKRSETQNASD